MSVCKWEKKPCERAALWGVIGPPAYSLQPIHRKNGCLGGSGGFFPRVVPKLRRDLLFFRALWRPFGPARAYIPAAGAISAGNGHRLAGLLCVVAAMWEGKLLHLHCLGADSSVLRSWCYCVLFGRLNTIERSRVVFPTVRSRPKLHPLAVFRTVSNFVSALSAVSGRISRALCGGGFILAAWLYLTAHRQCAAHTDG